MFLERFTASRSSRHKQSTYGKKSTSRRCSAYACRIFPAASTLYFWNPVPRGRPSRHKSNLCVKKVRFTTSFVLCVSGLTSPFPHFIFVIRFQRPDPRDISNPPMGRRALPAGVLLMLVGSSRPLPHFIFGNRFQGAVPRDISQISA